MDSCTELCPSRSKKRFTLPHQLDRQTKMSDSEHQETVAREDDGDSKENDQPATANLTRALEVAEELLQAIKQATLTPTGKQSVLEPPVPRRFSLPGVPPNYKKKKKLQPARVRPQKKILKIQKKKIRLLPRFPLHPKSTLGLRLVYTPKVVHTLASPIILMG